MADFSYLSDTDESAVEELVSQAQDLCVLEQVSAINCSSFTDSSGLPTELESRFRKLKSFPLTKPKAELKHSTQPPYTNTDFNNYSAKGCTLSGNAKEEDAVSSPPKRGGDEKAGFRPRSPSEKDSSSLGSADFSMEKGVFSPLKGNHDGKRGSEPISKHGSISSHSNSSHSSLEDMIFSTSKQRPEKKMRAKSKSKAGLFSSPLGSSNSSRESPSPPAKAGCFWCSPKKGSHKKSKENRATGIGLDWSKNDDFLSDLSTFSTKKQQKMLKKAMKEEENIIREAEKIVKSAKHASARLSVSGIEDELSDD
ncbi:hypothetical protein CJ030_MR0G005317 [Morella rubra]|uniref:Uncharacterized protein n=1 Tax=Morella rubra TaxID=262757 RepID=A0A6A1ULC7_9ROSI|nr:hypothetical protein CJ030_MR0G005317 [Morella rubra]